MIYVLESDQLQVLFDQAFGILMYCCSNKEYSDII